MKEEVMKILKMIQDGKISAEDGYKLLEALGEVKGSRVEGTGKFLKIEVKSPDGDNVSLSIPTALLKLSKSFLPRDVKEELEAQQIDLDEILRLVQEGAVGTLVDIVSSDGDVVKIYVE